MSVCTTKIVLMAPHIILVYDAKNTLILLVHHDLTTHVIVYTHRFHGGQVLLLHDGILLRSTEVRQGHGVLVLLVNLHQAPAHRESSATTLRTLSHFSIIFSILKYA